MIIKAYAALTAGGKLEPFEYDPGELGVDQVEIDISSCGICHSDLSMLNNDWQMTEYPLVPGHEIVGKIGAIGERVTHLKPGQSVGLGWFSKSCMTCSECMSGNYNLCPTAEGIIVGRHGGFANKVRADKAWVIPLPEGIDVATAGPLFCGGITVFNPIIQNNIQPTDRVGVVGIGGLGHMALRFLNAWGCEVTAFSTSPGKEAEARELGAHHFVSTHDADALDKLANSSGYDPGCGQCRPELGRLHQRTPAKRQTSYRRGGTFGLGDRIPAYYRSEIHRWVPAGQSGNHGNHDRVRRQTRHRSGNRNISHVQGQ